MSSHAISKQKENGIVQKPRNAVDKLNNTQFCKAKSFCPEISEISKLVFKRYNRIISQIICVDSFFLQP